MDPIVVVGAGISGVACAQTLRAAGLPVVVLDRGHAVGGRMSSRRLDGRPVDTGASYFTVGDPRFHDQVSRWQAAGLAHPWTDTFLSLAPGQAPEVKPGPVRWGATAGLRSLVEDLARGLDIREEVVGMVSSSPQGALDVDGSPARSVVLAMPDPQARRLLGPGLIDEARVLDHTYLPVLALSTVWSERTWDLDGAFVHDDPAIDWIADDGRRRGDGAPVLVVHSTSSLAHDHLEDVAAAVPTMLDALRGLVDLVGEPVATHMQRWSFAKPAVPRDSTYLLTDRLVGVCGDGWSSTPKVEAAYVSGLELGQALAERLS